MTKPKPRHDGWTHARMADFFRTLSYHGNVARAAREVGMSTKSAYRLRARHPDIPGIWDVALKVARAETIAAAALQHVRAVPAKVPGLSGL